MPFPKRPRAPRASQFLTCAHHLSFIHKHIRTDSRRHTHSRPNSGSHASFFPSFPLPFPVLVKMKTALAPSLTRMTCPHSTTITQIATMMRVLVLFLAVMVANGVASSCKFQDKDGCEAAGCSWAASPRGDDIYHCYTAEFAAASFGSKKYNFSAIGPSSGGSCVDGTVTTNFGGIGPLNDDNFYETVSMNTYCVDLRRRTWQLLASHSCTHSLSLFEMYTYNRQSR